MVGTDQLSVKETSLPTYPILRRSMANLHRRSQRPSMARGKER